MKLYLYLNSELWSHILSFKVFLEHDPLCFFYWGGVEQKALNEIKRMVDPKLSPLALIICFLFILGLVFFKEEKNESAKLTIC